MGSLREGRVDVREWSHRLKAQASRFLRFGAVRLLYGVRRLTCGVVALRGLAWECEGWEPG
jgi:hypothetical protein